MTYQFIDEGNGYVDVAFDGLQGGPEPHDLPHHLFSVGRDVAVQFAAKILAHR